MGGANPRAEQRVNAQLRVRMRASGPDTDANILDASSRGMLMSASVAPARGEIVEVFIGGQVVVGQVRWTNGNQFGLKLGDRIDVQALVSGQGRAVRANHAPAAMALEAEEADDTSATYNFLFFFAAALASLGFVLMAVQKTLG